MVGSQARARGGWRPRTRVEIGAEGLTLTTPDAPPWELWLVGAEFTLGDATFARRFVRHLHVQAAVGLADLITPPEDGAIAPRAAQLPRVPDQAGIVDRPAFDTLTEWIVSGGRLGGRTIEELARLARIATAGFAIVIGELAGHLASETTWPWGGPMRGGATGDDLRRQLRPLELAARDSQRAGEALVAAMAAASR